MVSPRGTPPLHELAAVFEDPLWAELYAACCVDTGEPASLERARRFQDALLVQNPETQQECLSLRCLRIGPVAVSCLASLLKDRPYTKLELSDNQLGDYAVVSVRSLVRALPRLRWLGLTGNLITAEGMRELAEELETNETLESLVLGIAEPACRSRGFRPNVLGSEGLEALLDAMLQNTRTAITSLMLNHTSLSAEAGRHLASFMSQNNTLLYLDVSGNPLSSEGVCTLLPQATRLRGLDVSDTGCRGELIHSQLCALCHKSSSLVYLSLAHNPLETRPMRRIARALAGCQSLVSLSLEDTSLDVESVTILVDSLLVAPVQSLTELDISGNQLAEVEAATALAHAMGRSVLQVLRLNRNPLGDAGVREIAEALDPDICPGGTLQHLEISGCRVGVAGASHLFSCLAQNRCLRVLRMADNFLDESLDLSLIERLDHVQELQLAGSRLPHGALLQVAGVCSRNRQRVRDKAPKALRAEMHRLLFQKTKLDQARQQVASDETEIAECRNHVDQVAGELRQLRASESELQRQLGRQIENEEADVANKMSELARVSQDLEESARAYEELHLDLRRQLREREQDLANLQVASEEVDQLLEQRRQEHPQQVEGLKAALQQALADTLQLQDAAAEMRQQLKSFQEKSLINFKP